MTVDGYFVIYQPDYTTSSVGTIHYHKRSESTRKLNNTKSAKVRSSIEGLYTEMPALEDNTHADADIFSPRRNGVDGAAVVAHAKR